MPEYPLSNFTVITPPATEPVTVAEAKAHLRVDFADDDTYIGTLITAAREDVEATISRALVTRTIDYYRDQFPGIRPWPRSDVIELVQPPLIAITWLKFTDTYGTVRTWTPSGSDLLNELGVLNAHVDVVNSPGRIRLAYSQVWPTQVLRTLNGITIRYTCGYGAAAAVPVRAKQAMMMLIGTWYENRESVISGRGITSIAVDDGVARLLAPLKNWNFA